MESILEFFKNNVDIIRPIWFSIGLIGLLIMSKYTRKSFYKDRSSWWWIYACLYYIMAAPLIFLVAIITLFNPERG